MRFSNVNNLLWVLSFFIFTLFGYMVYSNYSLDKAAKYHNSVHNLELYSKEFDNFLLTQNKFINYDVINKKVKFFEDNLAFLSSQTSQKIFPLEYITLIQKVQKSFSEKEELIEHFKSNNAQLLYSMHYLFDLTKAISKESNTTIAENVKNVELNLLKFYINPTTNTKNITDKISFLESLKLHNEALKYFIVHSKLTLHKIKQFHLMKTKQQKNTLQKNILLLDNFLTTYYEHHIYVIKIVIFFFVITVIAIILLLIFTNKKVEYMAYHDSLTKLANRTNIELYLQERIGKFNQENSKIAVLFIDLDRFKNINDTLGHHIGDALLQEVATRIQTVLAPNDILARVGGDEFMIISENSTKNFRPAKLSKEILSLFTQPIKVKGHTLSITMSIGVSIAPDDDLDAAALLKFADIAMYEAKDSGKNRYKFYKERLSILANDRLDIEQSLINSLNNNEFFVVYQPKYDIQKRKTVGLEALVRWQNPKLGFVSPEKFIPVTEEMGLIIELGLFIFKQACQDFMEFKKHSQYLHSISINVSAIQFYEENFIDTILAIIDEVGIDISSIKIEITETHIMKNIEHSMAILNQLRLKGFEISIDDFGTGHSSLSYLKRFPINELKIDKSFVDDIPQDKSSVAIVDTIITLSKHMHYVNVAEGIETLEQNNFLLSLGCEIGQGYFFSKPLNAKDLITFIQKE